MGGRPAWMDPWPHAPDEPDELVHYDVTDAVATITLDSRTTATPCRGSWSPSCSST